ncbi:hypothetical protein K438DRAFT_2021139 [Mycena galopus ATCC 62051]|nr:hypothetical protein K438DRAFT_2021139 [Mycena galopus ATCC 62051]
MYYSFNQRDISSGLQALAKALKLAIASGDMTPQVEVLTNTANILWLIGDYPTAKIRCHESQRLTQSNGDLFHEAHALWVEAKCCSDLGEYSNSKSLAQRARKLLELCGMSGGNLDICAMVCIAEAHFLKSEYTEARHMHSEFVQRSVEDAHTYVATLLNLSQIDIIIGASSHDVHQNLDKAVSLLQASGSQYELNYCNIRLAELALREGATPTAKLLFKQSFNSAWGKDSQATLECLEKLADTVQWPNDFDWASRWTVVYLAYAIRKRIKSALDKAIQFLGNVFLRRNDPDTAHSLFIVALDGFTAMDIHRSRGQCMLHLGDIAKQRGDSTKAKEFWKEARPLFERSLQEKSVVEIDNRVATINSGIH